MSKSNFRPNEGSKNRVRLLSNLIILLIAILTASSDGQTPKNAALISSDDTLKGLAGVTIDVQIDGIRDFPKTTYESAIEAKLRQNGIAILPSNDGSKKAVLQLNVNAVIWRDGFNNPYTVYSIALKCLQIFPVQTSGQTTKMAMVSTWDTGSFGIMPAIQASLILEEVDKLTAEFTRSWLKVNPANPIQITNPKTPIKSGNSDCATKTFNISDYVATGIAVKRGDAVTITASGSIVLGLFAGASGPNGIGFALSGYSTIKNLPHGSLIGRIRPSSDNSKKYFYRDGNQLGNEFGEWALIGDSRRVILDEKSIPAGVIDFDVNDREIGNNAGSYAVEVTVCRVR